MALAGVAGVVLLGGAAPAAWLRPTSAAWADPVVVAAAASSGAWLVADGCVWVDVTTNQPVTPAPPCTVTVAIKPYYGAGINYVDGTTGRAAQVDVTFPQATNTRVPLLTLHLNQGIIPSDWSWSTSRLTSFQVTPTAPCTTLPLATGLKGMPWYSTAEFVLWERGTAGPLVCTGS